MLWSDDDDDNNNIFFGYYGLIYNLSKFVQVIYQIKLLLLLLCLLSQAYSSW